MSASASSVAEVAAPDVPDPVRVRLLQRPVGERVEERPDPVGDAAQDGVRERDGALQPGAADELDGLVHRGVAGDALEPAELVRAEAQRGAHGRVELRDAAAAEGLDRVVDRPHALDGAVREPLRQRAVALVEARGGGA